VVELDGGQHAEVEQAAHDSQRTTWLEQNGYRELRFWNHDVLKNLDSVKQAIHSALQRQRTKSDPLSPCGRELE
jgi:very-short-patch-repair endonuclease